MSESSKDEKKLTGHLKELFETEVPLSDVLTEAEEQALFDGIFKSGDDNAKERYLHDRNFRQIVDNLVDCLEKEAFTIDDAIHAIDLVVKKSKLDSSESE